jgi:hypothetical protein
MTTPARCSRCCRAASTCRKQSLQNQNSRASAGRSERRQRWHRSVPPGAVVFSDVWLCARKAEAVAKELRDKPTGLIAQTRQARQRINAGLGKDVCECAEHERCVRRLSGRPATRYRRPRRCGVRDTAPQAAQNCRSATAEVRLSQCAWGKTPNENKMSDCGRGRAQAAARSGDQRRRPFGDFSDLQPTPRLRLGGPTSDLGLPTSTLSAR